MPSRRKKALRDSTLTRTFFNQANSKCACCPEHHPNHATGQMIPGASGLDDSEMFRGVMSSLWKGRYNNLTTEERQGVHAAIEKQPQLTEPLGVLQVLRFAHKQMADVPATADQFPPMETFDLGNLDDVAEEYDELCEKYRNEEERKMASMAGLVSNFAFIASGEKCSPEDVLAAELDLHNFKTHSTIMVPLTSCLRQVQLFNIEKRFGFVEESYQELSNDDQRSCGEDVPAELPLSFRQKMDNPFRPMASVLKPRKRGKKKPSALQVLTELQRNCKFLIEEKQNIEKTPKGAEESVEPPSLEPAFMYADVPVPEDIPDNIRQRFFNAESAFGEVLVLQEEASKQLLSVRSTFVAWYSAGHEVWEVGKSYIHEMLLFREYEHTRTALQAMFSIAARQEVKIVEFYSSEGAPKLPQAMNEAFRLESMSHEEFQKDWEMRRLKLQNAFPSVDKMLAGMDDMLKETPEADQTEWWKWLIHEPE